MSTDRTDLAAHEPSEFVRAVIEHVEPLMLLHGLQRTCSASTLVRYEKPGVYLNVVMGRSSCELGIQLGEDPSQLQSYSMSELIRLDDPDAADRYRNPTARSDVQIHSGLRAIAGLLGQHAASMLDQEPGVFERLAEQKERWRVEYADEVLFTQLRPRAAEAFRAGNFAKAVELLERIEHRLGPADRKKLELARRRVREG